MLQVLKRIPADPQQPVIDYRRTGTENDLLAAIGARVRVFEGQGGFGRMVDELMKQQGVSATNAQLRVRTWIEEQQRRFYEESSE